MNYEYGLILLLHKKIKQKNVFLNQKFIPIKLPNEISNWN